MAGFNTEKYNNRYLSVKRMGLITESIPEIGAATGEDKINEASAYTWATAGFFGRINYDYDGRYLLEVNGRYDGSSRFASDHRWGCFPSVSVGWNITRESLMEESLEELSNLK